MIFFCIIIIIEGILGIKKLHFIFLVFSVMAVARGSPGARLLEEKLEKDARILVFVSKNFSRVKKKKKKRRGQMKEERLRNSDDVTRRHEWTLRWYRTSVT